MKWLPILALCILCASCKKDEPEAPVTPPGPVVLPLWSPSLQVVRSGMADTLISPEWTFTSATTAQPVNGGAFHYMLQEAVMQRVGSDEQWRIGFIGTFLTDSGQPATPRQCGSMALIADHYYGRYRWSEEDQLYETMDGVRVAWQDPSGALWASDQSIAGPNSVFEVTASEVTGAITGTIRQVRIRFSCALRGPNMATIGATGEYVGPLVVL